MPYKDIEEKRAKTRIYMKQYEKEHVKERQESNKRYKDRLRAYLLKYREEHPCIRCGEAHPACLDFHHRNPEDKDIDVGLIVRQGWGIARVEQELKKCDVLCSNCHRKLHWAERSHNGILWGREEAVLVSPIN